MRVLLLLLVLVLYACGSTEEYSFSSYADEGLVELLKDGWIPPNISQGAFQIKEKYDLENQHVFGYYEYEEAPFRRGLKNLPSSRQEFDAALNKIATPSMPGWFEEYHNSSELEYSKFGDFYFAELKEMKIVLFIR